MFRHILSTLLVVAAPGTVLSVSHALANELTVDELIAKWAEAVGGGERLATIDHLYTRSHISTSGLEGTVEEWTTVRGESRQNLDLGGVFGTQTVFDGTRGWLLDHNGKVKDLQGKDLEDQVTSAYFSSLSHLLPGRLGGTITSGGRDETAETYRLEVAPDGGKPVTVHLDAESFLPTRQERQAEDRIETVYLSEWRDEGGLKIPHAVRVTTGDPKYDALIRVEEVVVNGPEPEGLFTRPAEGPRDYQFTDGGAARDIPFELNSNHIYLEAHLNGKGPLWFIFDTGAGATVIDAARAAALGLEGQGKIEGRGAGEASVDVSVITGASFTLPGVELLGQTVMAIPLAQLEPYEGRTIDGILGYDLISRFVVAIDYAARRIHLYEPAGYKYEGEGERVPIILEDNHPHVVADVSATNRTPVKANFLIDTGARVALHLSKPFCDEHRFAEAVRTIAGGFGAGVGGETKQQIGRMATLRLGQLVLNDVIAGFSEDAGGAMASKESAGLIGGDVLRRFTVIFDYSRHEMILEPNADFGTPFEYDMCGAFLRTAAADPQTFEIHRRIDGSPAAAAGLADGDIITAVDGKSSRELSLEEVRQMFLIPGKEYSLRIKRGDETRQVTVKTRRLI